MAQAQCAVQWSESQAHRSSTAGSSAVAPPSHCTVSTARGVFGEVALRPS